MIYEREEYFSNNKVYDYIYDYLKKFGIEKDASLLDVVNLIKNMNPVSIQLLFRGMPAEQAKLLKKLSSEEFLDVVEKYYPLRLIYNMGKYANVLSITELEKRTKRYDNWIEENQELVDFAKAGLLIGPKAAYKVGKYILIGFFFLYIV